MKSTERNQIIDYILRGNEMIRRHAEDKHKLLEQIIEFINNSDEPHEQLVTLAISEAASIREHIDNIELKISGATEKESKDYLLLKQLNTKITVLDQYEGKKEELVDKIYHADANLTAREELIEILHEYIDLEKVQSHRLITELSEVQDSVEMAQHKLDTYEKLSKHDSRFNALKILGLHPQGMSLTQLSYMLDTTRYEANKIITQLLEMGIIEHVGSGELVRVTEIYETQFALSIPA